MPRLKVYGGMVMRATGQHRAIIAAHNAQQVADKLGNASAHYVRGYWSVTGNEKELLAAKADPMTLLIETPDRSGCYVADEKIER